MASSIKARLDTRPDRVDLRDRTYQPPLTAIAPEYPPAALVESAVALYVEHDMVLDQGTEGACTGFGLASLINSLLWRAVVIRGAGAMDTAVDDQVTPPEKVSPRMLYHLARFYDEWPGEDYEGSSCRGALKAWLKHGVCSERLWPYRDPADNRVRFVPPAAGWQEDAASRPLGVYYRVEKGSIRDMQAAIQQVGAVFCSAQVHDGWALPKLERKKALRHANLPAIRWNPGTPPTGGHAFALVGYAREGFVLQNSWGPQWGLSGFALLSYDDWLANGSDAWVAVMGAPIRKSVPMSFISGELSEAERDGMRGRTGAAQGATARNGQTNEQWSTQQAYLHSVVMGNDGKVVNRLVAQPDGPAAIRHVVVERALEFFEKQGGKPIIALYAHGGLNSEKASLKRIQAMGHYFEANGIYPVFFSWRTGLLESLGGILEDAAKRLFPHSKGIKELIDSASDYVADALDRTIEVAAENLGVKAIWSQMKQNAEAASQRGNGDRGVFLTTLALAELKQAVPEVSIHLVGHSAGSILLGHMLDDFPRNKLQVSSCTLYAAACSIAFAQRHYRRAIERNGVLALEDLHLDLLDDRRELDDSVGPYRKSLLYLVSRALETAHKTPLLGLANAFDADKAKRGGDYNHWHPSTLGELQKWQAFWGDRELHLITTDQVPTRARWKKGAIEGKPERFIDAAHGAFDNDVSVVSRTLKRIADKAVLDKPVSDLDY